MSAAGWTAIAALGTTTLALFGGWLRRRYDRIEQRRGERLAAYADFATVVDHAAHRIGNLTREPMDHSVDEALEASNAFGMLVTPAYHVVELLGTRDARRAARVLYATSRKLRQEVAEVNLADRPSWSDPRYLALRDPMLAARDAFLAVARHELGGDGDSGD